MGTSIPDKDRLGLTISQVCRPHLVDTIETDYYVDNNDSYKFTIITRFFTFSNRTNFTTTNRKLILPSCSPDRTQNYYNK